MLLMGSALAPAGELAGAIAEQRRKSRGARLTLIPVDARDLGRPHAARRARRSPRLLLARLKSGA